MLDQIVFKPAMAKDEYSRISDELSGRLMVLQQQAKAAKLGTVILFEGWHAAGKGARISDLVVNLDPRLYSVHNITEPVGYEARLPLMQRFWSRLEPHGTMTIFNRAYYDVLSRDFVAGVCRGDITQDRKTRDRQKVKAMERLRANIRSARSFEEQLRADGYLIVKFFLHISKEEQTKRTLDLMLDPETAWKVDNRDMFQLQHYEDYYGVFDRWLGDPEFSAGGNWHLVPSMHRRNANVQIMTALMRELTCALEERGFDTSQPIPAGDEKIAAPTPAELQFSWDEEDADASPEPESAQAAGAEPGPQAAQEPEPEPELGAITCYSAKEIKRKVGTTKGLKSAYKLVDVPMLEDVRHGLLISDNADYHRQLRAEREKLEQLSLALYRRKIPLIIAYEGWDAAGKGGNIKRVAKALDARNYRVHPISSPTAEELAHPFLWRFWTRLPRTGHVAIFDRTWYGRVLVERIEGFAKPWEWRRAYEEINDFEHDLHSWGAVLVKFWIDVSYEEQLRRFQSRQDDPTRRWKITQEDWRNRAQNMLYHTCVNDMLRLTSTDFAPWTVVESDDKHYARVKALKVINKAVEERLAR